MSLATSTTSSTSRGKSNLCTHRTARSPTSGKRRPSRTSSPASTGVPSTLKCSELITRACCAPRYHLAEEQLGERRAASTAPDFWQNVLWSNGKAGCRTLLAEQPSNRIERHQQRCLQQALWRHRVPATRYVHPIPCPYIGQPPPRFQQPARRAQISEKNEPAAHVRGNCHIE